MMKAVVVGILFFTLSATAAFAAQGDGLFPRVCVLNFERPEHVVTSFVEQIYQGVPGFTIHNLAIPTDFVDCIRDQNQEIVIIAHALETPASSDGTKPVNLAYFRNLQGEERQIAMAAAGVTNYPANDPYYVLRPVLPKVMSLAREELANQRQGGQVALKKIRLMACLPNQVLAEYDDLRALIQENGIQLDLAPTLPGKNTVAPDIAWMAKSVDCSHAKRWKTEKNPSCEQDWWPGCDRAKTFYCKPL